MLPNPLSIFAFHSYFTPAFALILSFSLLWYICKGLISVIFPSTYLSLWGIICQIQSVVSRFWLFYSPGVCEREKESEKPAEFGAAHLWWCSYHC